MPEESYIRGAPAATVDSRRVGRVLAYLVVLALAGSAVVMAVLAMSSDSSASRLKRHGVSVEAAVTSCVGISSGIGMGVEYYDCSGRYSLNGQSYVEVIHGSRTDLPIGTVVPALAVPGDPASLSLPGAVRSSSHGSWVAAIVLGAAAVAGAAALIAVSRRPPDTPRGSGSAPVPT